MTPKYALNTKKVDSVTKNEEKLADEMASFSGNDSPKRTQIMSDTETEQLFKKHTTPRVVPDKKFNFTKSPKGSFISPRVPGGIDLSAMSNGSAGGLSSQMNIEHLDQI